MQDIEKGGDAVTFPRGFFWGTAVSAYQVEGGIESNDWAAAARRGLVPPARRACDFWNRYEHYLDLAKSLGTNAFRFSIEWARVEPHEGEWDDAALEHYRTMIEAMRARALEPFVTLWHFTLPQWVAERGGWANPRTVEWFGAYVRRAAESLKDSVRYWLIINEPSVVLSQGYLQGTFPPGKRFAFREYLSSRRNLTRAVIDAATVLHTINPACMVGSAFNIGVVEPARAWNPGDVVAARLLRRFDDREFIASVSDVLDFIGLNYYMKLRVCAYLLPRPTVRPYVPAGKPVSDLGWEIFPEGLTRVLHELRARFAKPIIVTENGIADAGDDLRPSFLRDHLRAVAMARAAGVDVRGYFHWSLMDNFEWAYGFGPRFGLYEMDYDLMEATERKSAAVYRALIRAHS